MKRDSLCFLPGLVLALGLGAFTTAAPAISAQDAAEAVTAKLPTAASLIDKFEALTNAKKVAESTSFMHAKGKMIMASMGLEGTMEVWEGKPDLSLMLMEMGAMGTMTMGYNDGVAYSSNAMMGSQILEGIELLQRKLEAGYGTVKDRALYESIETVGKESFAGKDCYKVKLVAKPFEGMDAAATVKGRTFYEFFDAETGMMIGTVMTQQSQMGEMEVTSVIDEYKKFGEATLACKTTQKLAMGEIVLEILEVEFPETLDASVFALPKDVAAQVEKKKAAAK